MADATTRGRVATLLERFLRRFEGVSHDATKENQVPEGAQGRIHGVATSGATLSFGQFA